MDVLRQIDADNFDVQTELQSPLLRDGLEDFSAAGRDRAIV